MNGGYAVFGFNTTIENSNNQNNWTAYGKAGSWGLYWSGAIYEETTTRTGVPFKAGDVLTIYKIGLQISYAVNGQNNSYRYTMNGNNYYFCFSSWYAGDVYELVD
jgi:hypothetical protein